MKQNIYIFSDTILKRKNNTISFESVSMFGRYENSDYRETDFDETLIDPTERLPEGQKKYIPVENVDSIFCFGDIRLNSNFINFLEKYSIPVHFFNYYGKYTGSVIPPKKSNISGVTLGLQFQAFRDITKRLYFASEFILAASHNMICNMKIANKSGAKLNDEIDSINTLREKIKDASSVEEILGYEGQIRHIYYKSWNKLLKHNPDFTTRNYNPPVGMVNALISYANMVLYGICTNEIYRTQLSPFIGYLHSPGDNKSPLSYDIAEIFKPIIVDKTIFRVLNLGMIKEKHFNKAGDYYYLRDDAKKVFISELDDKLKSTVEYEGRIVSLRSLIRIEAFKILNHLKGEKVYSSYHSGL